MGGVCARDHPGGWWVVRGSQLKPLDRCAVNPALHRALKLHRCADALRWCDPVMPMYRAGSSAEMQAGLSRCTVEVLPSDPPAVYDICRHIILMSHSGAGQQV